MATDGQIEAWIARGKQAVSDALDRQPFRGDAVHKDDVVAAIEAWFRQMIGSKPDDEVEPQPEPELEPEPEPEPEAGADMDKPD